MDLFGTSGIRRIVDKELFELAFKIGLAIGRIYQRILVGRDTRTSSDALKYSLISGLLASGVECFDAGIIPTPTLALATKEFDIGIMITASHNPPHYNGIKLVNSNGSAFDTRQKIQIVNMVSDTNLSTITWEDMKNLTRYDSAVEQHIGAILQNIKTPLNLKIVLDCGGGAGSLITPQLLNKMGCTVIEMNCTPSGFFSRKSEPTKDNLKALIAAVKDHNADLGIAHDGDADRTMVIDDKGRFVTGDKLLIIFAQAINAQKIATTVDTSMVIDEIGLHVTRTKVGDPYVSEELRKGGDFGGEPSGSWIFPNISLCPDGIFAAALVAEIASKQKISSLSDGISNYFLIRGHITSNSIIGHDLNKLFEEMKPKYIDYTDGTKLYFNDGWILVRESGTEPKIRLTVEAKTEIKAKSLYRDSIKIIERYMNRGGNLI